MVVLQSTLLSTFIFLLHLPTITSFHLPSKSSIPRSSSNASSLHKHHAKQQSQEYDVIVVGSGIGGLAASSLCARYQFKTLCLEAHDVPGGVAHSFQRKSRNGGVFTFDSGPSLLSGMSERGSTNPLRQVMEAVGVAGEVDWVTYDGWMVYDKAYPTSDPKSSFRLTTGSSSIFEQAIESKAGTQSRHEFTQFKSQLMKPGGLSESSAYIPPLALRGDFGAVITMIPYLFKFLQIGLKGTLLTGSFTNCMNKYGVKDKFVSQWFDYLAFALSGLDAAHTQAAPVAYTMIDLHKKGAVLDYPRGGLNSLIQALVKGLTMDRGDGVGGGELRLNSRVKQFLLEESNDRAKCTGVVLEDGTVINSKYGVICNAPLWNMAKLLEDSITNPKDVAVAKAVKEVRKQAGEMQMTGSFMHLHLGIPSDGLEGIDCHHSVLNLEEDVTAEQNLVIVSIPTVFDPSLAPDGYHVVHAYTAASEDFKDWETMLVDGSDNSKTEANDYKRSKEYKELKEEKAEALWLALERIIPDIRERAKRPGSVVEVGTPLTHRRYNRRFRGTYGPAPSIGKDVWELLGPKTPIDGLLACGDTTFPGIGLPGVAASGTIAANTLVDVDIHMKLIQEMKESGALQ